MGKNLALLVALFLATQVNIFGQSLTFNPTDTLTRSVVQLQNDLYQVELNLHKAQKDLKVGILVATIGYSVTILGGQLLGENPDVGRGLLYVGGATGIAGTFFLVRGFKKISLGPPRAPYPQVDLRMR